MQPATPHTDELNIAERLGAGLLRRMSHREHSAVARWPAGVLSRIRRLERAVVIQAALLGALAGAILGAVELGLVAWQGVDRGGEGLAEQWRYWLVYLGAALLVSMIEIGLMYWRILAAVARMGSLAGLDLSHDDAERMMSLGLSRAALDIPNPRAPFFGIDPYARQPRWKLLLHAVAYRLKVGATSVVLRLLLRRLLARVTLRSLIPFAAIAVYAVWNAIVVTWIMRETRHRTAGPLAIDDLGGIVRKDRAQLSASSREAIVAALAESITLGQDAHPNYVLLVGAIVDWLDVDPATLTGEWPSRRDSLKQFDAGETRTLLRVLAAATVLNGRPRRRQRDMLADVASAVGHQLDVDALAALRERIADGQGLSADALDAAVPSV